MVPATIQQASPAELRDELIRIKQREKKLKDEAKAKTSKLIGSAITIASAAGLGHILGGKERDLKAKAEWATWDEKKREEELKKDQTVMGIDLDLLVGLAGLGLGLSDGAGEFADTLTAIGVGGVSSYASRSLYARARDEKEEEKSE